MKKIPAAIFIFALHIHTAGQVQQPVDYVDVFTGTSNSRWMLFPGPTHPFGMVKLSPDNQSNVWNGGYEYTVASVSGFSHIHSWSMGGLSLMPFSGKARTWSGPPDGPFGHMWTAGYRSRIDKTTETGGVGYYGVELYDYDIYAELTATPRCGYLRFSYPAARKRGILFNFNFEYEENAPSIDSAVLRVINSCEVEGSVSKRSSFADTYTVHFVARFSHPIRSFKTWQALPFEGTNLYGTDWQREVVYRRDSAAVLQGDCGLTLFFGEERADTVEVQTAISLVSREQARINLEREMDPFGWDFRAVVDHCRDTWNQLLTKIEVSGREADKKKFYTNLYRAYAARTLWDDANGYYRDMCEEVKQLEPPADHIYGSDALWGSHWNLFPLWTLLTPGIANSWVNSLLTFYDDGGWLPQGPEGIEYCEVMVGAHQVKLITSAYQKGIRNYDISKAYEAAWKSQTVPGINHPCGGWAGNKNLDSFLEHGYVANEDGPVSNTMEIAFDSWAVGQFARALGREEDYKKMEAMADNYRLVFDPQTRFIRQRHASGEWVAEWDSLENHGTWYGAGYVEGTAWHYSFFVPHDLPVLADMVGEDRFIRRLEEGFENGYIDIGNQPNMQAPFIFNYTSEPWLTQKYTRKLLEEAFNTSPLKGWPGEEDQGQLGAWYVMASMGLFQMKGGCSVEPYYDLSSPVFDTVRIHLDETYYPGNTFTIITRNNSADHVYIQRMTLNGEPFRKLRLDHQDLVAGGELILELGPDPNSNLIQP